MNYPKNFIPEPFEYHQELEITIESLTNEGVGIGRVEGWVVMVPFVLKDEIAKVRIYRNHKNYSEADLIEVLKASPARVEPNCKLFTMCGGCQYQHINYEDQLELKRGHVRELLSRKLGYEVFVEPAQASPKVYNYRSKLTPHFEKPRKKGEKFPIGFLKYGQRRQIIDVPHCPIATEAINNQLPKSREEYWFNRKLKHGGTVLLRDTNEGVIGEQYEIVSQKACKYTFQFNAGDFFQNNPFILPKLIEYVLGQAKVEGVNYLIDAYCGVGVFAIEGSSLFKKCIGVEVNLQAIKWAKGNALINQIKNCEFIFGNAEAIFENVESVIPEETAIILDPPRKGCDEVFLKQLIAFKPKRIVYVSCEPSTQARDLVSLLDAGYKIETVKPFDLFPQTRHIENVVTLSI